MPPDPLVTGPVWDTLTCPHFPPATPGPPCFRLNACSCAPISVTTGWGWGLQNQRNIPTTMPVHRALTLTACEETGSPRVPSQKPGPGLKPSSDSSTGTPPCLGAPAEAQSWQGAPQGLSLLRSPLPWAPPEQQSPTPPCLTPNLIIPCAGEPHGLEVPPHPPRVLRPHARVPGPQVPATQSPAPVSTLCGTLPVSASLRGPGLQARSRSASHPHTTPPNWPSRQLSAERSPPAGGSPCPKVTLAQAPLPLSLLQQERAFRRQWTDSLRRFTD